MTHRLHEDEEDEELFVFQLLPLEDCFLKNERFQSPDAGRK